MTLAFFIAYITSVFAGSAILFSLVKKFSSHFAASGRKPTVYGIISAIATSGASFLSTYISENLFTVFWILSGIYLFFGIIHHFLTHQRFFKHRPDNKKKTMVAELMFGMAIVLFTIAIFSALQYLLVDQSYLFFPMMMCTLAFFIPMLVVHTFDAVLEIPTPQYPTWQYPIDNPIDLPEEDPNEKLLVIGFELGKKISDTKRTYFRAKAPDGIKLGELFYHFINDYNELQSETQIEFTDELGQPCDWLFRTKGKGLKFSRILNHFHNIRENKILENTVIVAERALPENNSL
jgi:hypothetical protein